MLAARPGTTDTPTPGADHGEESAELAHAVGRPEWRAARAVQLVYVAFTAPAGEQERVVLQVADASEGMVGPQHGVEPVAG